MIRTIYFIVLVVIIELPMYFGDLSLQVTSQNLVTFSVLSFIIIGISYLVYFLVSRYGISSNNSILLYTSLILVIGFWLTVYIYNASEDLHFGFHDEVWFSLKHCLGVIIAYYSYRAAMKYA